MPATPITRLFFCLLLASTCQAGLASSRLLTATETLDYLQQSNNCLHDFTGRLAAASAQQDVRLALIHHSRCLERLLGAYQHTQPASITVLQQLVPAQHEIHRARQLSQQLLVHYRQVSRHIASDDIRQLAENMVLLNNRLPAITLIPATAAKLPQ